MAAPEAKIKIEFDEEALSQLIESSKAKLQPLLREISDVESRILQVKEFYAQVEAYTFIFYLAATALALWLEKIEILIGACSFLSGVGLFFLLYRGWRPKSSLSPKEPRAYKKANQKGTPPVR